MYEYEYRCNSCRSRLELRGETWKQAPTTLACTGMTHGAWGTYRYKCIGTRGSQYVYVTTVLVYRYVRTSIRQHCRFSYNSSSTSIGDWGTDSSLYLMHTRYDTRHWDWTRMSRVRQQQCTAGLSKKQGDGLQG